jgi:elongation factor P
MLKANDLRKGVIFEHESAPFLVVDYQSRAMGRGAGVVVVKAKNLVTGNVLEKSFRSTDSLASAAVNRLTMQYLYNEGSDMVFMNQETYDQVQIGPEVFGDQARFIAEGMEVTLLAYGDKIIGLDIPKNVPLKVTHAEPGARGDTAASALKPATVETGVQIMVPLFINEGDVIKVDTRTGQYLERQK